MNNLSWFEERVNSYVLRGSTEIFVDSLETANKLFYLQDEKKGYLFNAPIRIHRKPIEECESCSA